MSGLFVRARAAIGNPELGCQISLLPWMLGLSAARADAHERQRLADEIECVRRDGNLDQSVLLKTCHRVELYGFGRQPELTGDVSKMAGGQAISHLLRVAAGLESAVIGEDEVLHQVREALARARSEGPVDSRLARLFELAIAAGRRARAGRARSAAGLPGRALDWLAGHAELAGAPVLVVGGGHMGSALAHAASRRGAVVTIASRDHARAARLADVFGGRGVDLAEGAELAACSTAVVIALAGPWSELTDTSGSLPPTADLSAPSALPPSARSRLSGAFLGIDDLFEMGQVPPPGYGAVADQIVATKTEEYLGWLARSA